MLKTQKELRGTLSERDILLMSRYLYDGLTQKELAEEEGVWQTAISHRIQRAARKMNAAGLTVRLPGKGRKPKARMALCEPEALDRLVEDENDEATGCRRGHWQDAKRTTYDPDDN